MDYFGLDGIDPPQLQRKGSIHNLWKDATPVHCCSSLLLFSLSVFHQSIPVFSALTRKYPRTENREENYRSW